MQPIGDLTFPDSLVYFSSMKIHEYQAKEIFARYNIPVPREKLATNPEQALQASEEIGLPVVIKAQVQVGGRGKAGGIKLAKTPQEVRELSQEILSMEIKGIKVKKVLISEAVDIFQEVYLGITIDRRINSPVLMASEAGGVEIEEVAKKTPEKIIKESINPLIGLGAYQARRVGFRIFKDPKPVFQFTGIAKNLSSIFFDLDSSLVEINPLVITKDGRLLALDAKILFDDSGLYRHPDIENLRDLTEEERKEYEAKKLGLSYIKLTGGVGCIVNGAGLAMATMDLIKRYGGEPANFLDVGGSSSPEKMINAIKILLSDKHVRSIFINIFGGITRCDDVAQGLLEASKSIGIHLPAVIRLTGTNEDKAKEMLKGSNFIPVDTMAQGAKKAIELAEKGRGG